MCLIMAMQVWYAVYVGHLDSTADTYLILWTLNLIES